MVFLHIISIAPVASRCFFWVEQLMATHGYPFFRSGHRSAQVADGESAQEPDLEPKGFVGAGDGRQGGGGLTPCETQNGSSLASEMMGNTWKNREIHIHQLERTLSEHPNCRVFWLGGGGILTWIHFDLRQGVSRCDMNHGCQLLAILSIFWVWVKT